MTPYFTHIFCLLWDDRLQKHDGFTIWWLTCQWPVEFGVEGFEKNKPVKGNGTERLQIRIQTVLLLITGSAGYRGQGGAQLRYGLSGEGAGRTQAGRPPPDPDSAPSSSGSSSSPAGRWCPRAGSASGRCVGACSHRGREPGGLSAHKTEKEILKGQNLNDFLHEGVWRCFVVPQDPSDVRRTPSHGVSAGGLCGGIPGSSFCRDWDKGYIQTAPVAEATRGGPWGRPLCPRRCCEFCRSPPNDWGSRKTPPRCSTGRPPPTPGNVPPCCHSYKGRATKVMSGPFLLQPRLGPEVCCSSFLGLVLSLEVYIQTHMHISIGVRNVRVCLKNHHRKSGDKLQMHRYIRMWEETGLSSSGTLYLFFFFCCAFYWV